MTSLVLYTTEACHLCEQASSLLYQVVSGTTVTVDEVDIADDEELMSCYGVRIPVLKNVHTGQEISWPFDIQTIQQLL